ncbi:hypothetical protein [Paludibaculum fermentans]|uniref:DUF8021 domain-containing protein n=1 Tax=Paludibaculum fermentans TaxID=1473598 RepID=A0A7S7NSL2_PALFE|nr:hypothetical protein [Paludibaculum fermentans]QOY88965.1 hypothetical protein IRI77_03100 [Paludibaculum fermentans]
METSFSFIFRALLVLSLCTLGSAAATCDRPCLAKALDQYLTAIVKHDPAAAPLAPGFRYTENAAVTRPGTGIWSTASALGQVQRRYLDPVTGQAAYFGQIEESGLTNLATLRIRVVDGQITEGESIVARKSDGIFDGKGFAIEPPPQARPSGAAASSRQAMVAAAQSYLDGVQHHDGSRVLAVKGCPRIENGVLTASAPGSNRPPRAAIPGIVVLADCTTLEGFGKTIAAVDHRRFPVIDEEAGVVLAFAVFNRPPGATRGDGTPYPRNLLSELFVVRNNRIQSIYAIMHYMQPDIANAPGW